MEILYLYLVATLLFLLQFPLISSDPELGQPGSLSGRRSKTEIINELLNDCIDSKNHKSSPGPEDYLHSQCSPWKDRSCCTADTTVDAHYTKMYNFDWDHCAHASRLSDKCRHHFIQDLCFYECSPNVGPWKIEINQKFRKERFMDVPLCASDCDTWFRDCSDDYTCVANWGRGFDWVGGRNRCPAGSTCKTFSQVYKNSQEFCESIWDHSWKYASDNDYCMRLWFNASQGNPNDKVAKWKAYQLVSAAAPKPKLNQGMLMSMSIIVPFAIKLINIFS